MTWLYFIKKRSEVFENFLKFKDLLENQTDKKIKVLRTDSGGELCGKTFDQLCRKYDIVRQIPTPYMPQHNEVAERMNKTLMEKARSMLSDAGLTQD